MTSAATPGTRDGSAPPFPRRRGGAAGLGGRLLARPHLGSAWRRCLFLLPRLRARRGGGGRRQLQAGAWPGAAGRALLGRLSATGRGIEGLSRPRRGTAQRPEGSGLEGQPRSSPAEPRNPAPPCEGAEPFGAAGRGTASPGGAAPRAAWPLSAVSIAGRGRGASRPARRGSGLEGKAPTPFPCPAFPRDRAAAGRAPTLSCGATALGGIAELLGTGP